MHRMLAGSHHAGWNHDRAWIYSPRPRSTIEDQAPATSGAPGPFWAIVTQTADPRFRALDPASFPALEVLYDGRNSIRTLQLPPGVTYVGVGVQAAARVDRA